MPNPTVKTITDVGIDLDGVMYPFVDAFREYCSIHMPDGKFPEPQQWNFYRDWGIEDDTFHRWLYEGAQSHNLFSTHYPMQGSYLAWELLRKLKVRIHVMTARPTTAWKQTADWLHHHYLVPDNLYFTSKKSMLAHVATGTAMAIEDHVDYYEDLKGAGVLTVLYNQPWNIAHPNSPRVSNLVEFAQLVEQINNREIPCLQTALVSSTQPQNL
jgi:hypothetical protein